MMDPYLFVKLLLGVLATVGLYSVLYRETKVFRFFEHIFLGLASGYTLVAVVRETLSSLWWSKMLGTVGNPAAGVPSEKGYWIYALLLPIGLCGYTVFSRKHNWMSRIPIGLILGFYSGQQVQVWWNRWGTQIYSSMLPVFPTNFSSFTAVRPSPTMTPEQAANVTRQLYPSQAISNLVFVLTIICVLSYFFFSFDVKNRWLKTMNTSGRWLLMVGFGAIFGSTVMARFALVIDRMSFICIEFFRDTVFRLFS